MISGMRVMAMQTCLPRRRGLGDQGGSDGLGLLLAGLGLGQRLLLCVDQPGLFGAQHRRLGNDALLLILSYFLFEVLKFSCAKEVD